MTVLLTGTTELEAVNIMLSNIGESPVNSLNDEDVVDAGIAKTILASVNREVQTRGWWFNTEIDKTFLPNTEKRVIFGPHILRIDTSSEDVSRKIYVQRGRYLYDTKANSYTVEQPVKLTVVVGLQFSDIPESARRYITLRASRIFQERMLGAPSISSFNEKDEYHARAALIAEENEATDYNMLTSSITPQRTLNRRHLFPR